jgi:hypothetical protein
MFCCCALPGPIDFVCADAPCQGQMQPLTRHDRIEIGMLTQGAPVGFAQGWAAFFTALAPGPALPSPAESPLGRAVLCCCRGARAY